MQYYNRELSWIYFNWRVLEESKRKETPVMERCKFLAITASNLDEFFMVRVADAESMLHRGIDFADASGISVSQLIKRLSEKIHSFVKEQYACFNSLIIPALRDNGITFRSISELNARQKRFADRYFDSIIYPVLTPIAIDSIRPFPLLANKSINIAVKLMNRQGRELFAVIEVPSILPRLIELPSEKGREFILLEDIITDNLEKLFGQYEILNFELFRITRDSDLDIDEDAQNLVAEIKRSIGRRERGAPVRLELCKYCSKDIRSFLIDSLKVDKEEVYIQRGPLDLTFLCRLAQIRGVQKLCYEPVIPVKPPCDFRECDDIFKAIREKDRLVHHPYESFDVVIDFVQRAAADPNVLAIKQTLYRVSGKSPIVEALIKAAENGKQVTVLVELKARFDEENNIEWAAKLEKSGCHVVYGPARLKTHCKICLVVRKESDGIRRYLHLSTGNYNDNTACLYTDIGMFTCNEKFGSDASLLFNMLTGYSFVPEYKKFIAAPANMRDFFKKMITRETEMSKRGIPSEITFKVNSLVDPQIISLLYTASNAGVKINLIVRGICCLVPNIKGYSENIAVTSIVGRFLEHSRIFIFENGGNRQYFLGSADLMPRNLNRRVELLFPVEDKDLKRRIQNIADTFLRDTSNARRQLADTSYKIVESNIKKGFSSQEQFIKEAQQTEKSRTQTDAVYG